MNRGSLNDREITAIQKFIQNNYEAMYITWRAFSAEGYYKGE